MNTVWLEIKALITVFGSVFILISLLFTTGLTVLMLMMIFMGLGMIILGDVLVGYQITSNECKPLIDKTPPGQELTILKEIGGKIHFINTYKEKMGIRKFRWHKQDAAVINDGEGMFTTPNGNRGFFSHESYDKSISMILCKALEDMKTVTDTRDIKGIYEKAMTEIHEVKKQRVTMND